MILVVGNKGDITSDAEGGTGEKRRLRRRRQKNSFDKKD